MTANARKNIAAATRARLLALAHYRGDDYQRVLTRFAIERWLYRIGLLGLTRDYAFKGAMLYATWPEHVFRPTGDLDLLAHGDPSPTAITEIFAQVCAVDAPEDGFVFDSATLKLEALRETQPRDTGSRERALGADRASVGASEQTVSGALYQEQRRPPRVQLRPRLHPERGE